MSPKALGLAMSIPTISKGWEKETWSSSVLGSDFETVALEGISIPKWAQAGPVQRKTRIAAIIPTFFIKASFIVDFFR
jgi:hypothetical protein